MMGSKNTFLLCLAFVCSLQWVSGAPKPKDDLFVATAMLFRHGVRAPVMAYPTDPYTNYNWPMGFGQLTTKGVREPYKSGMIKATRYSALLRSVSGTQNFYAISSASERCVMSAESFLDGLTPDLYRQIQINVAPADQDTMLYYPGKDCNAFESETAAAFSPDRPEILAVTDNGAFLEYIANNTGFPMSDLLGIMTVGDILAVQRDNGFVLPPWAAPVFDTKFAPLIQLTFEIMSTTVKSQIRSGVLLKNIIDHFDLYLADTYNSSVSNFLIYSAHDVNVMAMLYTLNVFDQVGTRPYYSSTISWELCYRNNGKKHIDIRVLYYRDDADENPIILQIPGCPAPCSYSNFKKTLQSKLVSNYDEICGNPA